jgi:DNA polymerase-3 subunit gamma/tau
VKFIFATTEPHKLPDTITSRCQRFDFKRIGRNDVIGRLKKIAKSEKVKCGDGVLALVAKAGGGSMRDAQSVLEQILSFKQDEITEDDVHRVMGTVTVDRLFTLTTAIREGDPHSVLTQLDEVVTEGKDLSTFAEQYADFWRDVLILKTCGSKESFLDISRENLSPYQDIADALSTTALLLNMERLMEARVRMKEGQNSRVVLELTLIGISQTASLPDVTELAERIQKLEAALAGGAVPAAPTRPSSPAAAAPESTTTSETPAPVSSEATVPEPTTAPSGPAGSAEEIRREWSRVLSLVKQERATVEAFLREGVPDILDGDELTIAFGDRYKFHMQQLDSPERRTIIVDALERVFGKRYGLRIVARSGVASPEPAAEPDTTIRERGPKGQKPKKSEDTQKREVSSDPAVRKILETFQGKIIGVEE